MPGPIPAPQKRPELPAADPIEVACARIGGPQQQGGFATADAKTPSGDPIGPCRTCHLPLGDKDFVHRYDEYFATRVSYEPPVKRPVYGY